MYKTPVKRKKVVLTLDKKLLALQRIDSGESSIKIAKELGVGKSTVNEWRRYREKIENWCDTEPTGTGMFLRKSMRGGDHKKVDRALLLWFDYANSCGIPISVALLKEKALQFHKELGETSSFVASDGWIVRWKKRYEGGASRFGGSELFSDFSESSTSSEDFKNELFELIDKEGISGDQIYSCGETSLSYKLLPSKTARHLQEYILPSQEKVIPSCVKIRERVTVFACSNAQGSHKLRLTLIGTSNPRSRAFKNLKNREAFSLWYRYSQTEPLCITHDILYQWFHEEFVPSVEKYLEGKKLPRKAMLILNIVPPYLASEWPTDLASKLKDGDIKAIFIPPKMALLFQPTNQMVLGELKKKYRRRLLTCVTANNNEVFTSIVRAVDMVDVIRWLSEAWEEISPLLLEQAWKKLVDDKASNFLVGAGISDELDVNYSDEDYKLVMLLKKIPEFEHVGVEEIEEWMATEEAEFVDDKIIAMVMKEATPTDVKIEADEHTPNKVRDVTGCTNSNTPKAIAGTPNKIPHGLGCKAIKLALNYISQQQEATLEDLTCLKKWVEIAAMKRLQQSRMS